MNPNYDISNGFGFCFQDIPRETLDHINFKTISDLLELAPQFKQTLTQTGIYPSVILYETNRTAIIEADLPTYPNTFLPIVHYTVEQWLTKLAETMLDTHADLDDGIAVILFHIMCEIACGLGFSKDLLSLDFDEYQQPCIYMPKKMAWDIPEEDRNITLDTLLNQIILPVLSAAGIPNTNTHLNPLCDFISIAL